MHDDSDFCKFVIMYVVISRFCGGDARGVQLMAIFDNFMTGGYDVLDQFRFDYDEMGSSSTGRIAIVGLPNSGKKTLCNALWGWDAVHDSNEMSRNFGLLSLVDLPLDPYDVAGVLYRLENTDLIVFVLDSEQSYRRRGECSPVRNATGNRACEYRYYGCEPG